MKQKLIFNLILVFGLLLMFSSCATPTGPDENLTEEEQAEIRETVEQILVKKTLVEVDTLFLLDSVIVLDSQFTYDTLIIKNESYFSDTVLLSDSIYTLDSLFSYDTLYFFDTTYNLDTTFNIQVVHNYDTVYLFEEVVNKDSVFVFDTTEVFDSLFLKDSVFVFDTTEVFDTLFQKDSVIVRDTVVIKDTLFAIDTVTGIEQVLPRVIWTNVNDGDQGAIARKKMGIENTPTVTWVRGNFNVQFNKFIDLATVPANIVRLITTDPDAVLQNPEWIGGNLFKTQVKMYEVGTEYKLVIDAGITDIYGLSTDKADTITIIPEPYIRLTQISPLSGTEIIKSGIDSELDSLIEFTSEIDVAESFLMYFNKKINPDSVANYLSLDPPDDVDFTYEEFDYFYKVSFTSPLTPETDYKLFVGPEITDSLGNTIQHGYEVNFTTGL